MKRITFTAVVALASLAMQPTFAATSWDFTSGGTYTAGTGGTTDFGDTIKVTSGGVSATASAWANTGGSATTTDNTTPLQTAYLGQYTGNGLGVTNQDAATGDTNEGVSPEHAMDNQQRYDSILFSFSSAVKLNDVSVGWYSGDSDISVLAYTGAGVPVMAGLSYSQLIANGWTVIGNYANVGVGTAAITTNVSSSYWLVGAYDPLWGSGTNLDTGTTSTYDYVKIATVTATVSSSSSSSSSSGSSSGGKVPEPGSMTLVSAALAGMFVFRRRRAA